MTTAQTTAGTASDGYRVQPQPIPRPRHGDDPREPGRLLHAVRDAAAYVHDLAELGLALLCHDCDETHGHALRQLGGDLEETV